ncbi:MAG: hypothetical protein ACYTDX_01480 [Planctomycetota bacterium]|jgi:hypothetical protein
MRAVTLAAITTVLVSAVSASAALAVKGALKKGDSAAHVTLAQPGLSLGSFKGKITILAFNGWT